MVLELHFSNITKSTVLHTDLKRDDVITVLYDLRMDDVELACEFFAGGATLFLYDGNPVYLIQKFFGRKLRKIRSRYRYFTKVSFNIWKARIYSKG